MKNLRQHSEKKYSASTSSGVINMVKAGLHLGDRNTHSDFSDLPKFPENFLWGVATSSYQVEGKITGNDWHIFTTTHEIKKKIKTISRLFAKEIDLEPAGEAVHHADIDVLKEDLDRAKLLGMNAYRFSIEWSRIQPLRPRYLFRWDEVPGNDTEELVEFLKKKFGINWIEKAKIEKINNGRTITISSKKNLSLTLNDEKDRVDLKIDDGRTDEFIAKIENDVLNIYRFIFNEDALKYYQEAIDEMHKRGLKPIATLNHLSLPKWVLTPPRTEIFEIGPTEEDQGFHDSLRGWENKETVEAFDKLVNKVVKRYKKSVDTWITLNEPVGSVVGVGYIAGIFPPGFNLDGERAKKAYFNLLKAHVKAYRSIKSIYGDKPSFVGLAQAMMYPKVSSAAIKISAGIGVVICVFAAGLLAIATSSLIGLPDILGGALFGAFLGAGIGAIVGNIRDYRFKTFRLIKSIFTRSIFTGKSSEVVRSIMNHKTTRTSNATFKGAGIGVVVGGIAGSIANIHFALSGLIFFGVVLGIAGIVFVVASIFIAVINKAAKTQFDYFINYHFLDSLTSGKVDEAIKSQNTKRKIADAKCFFGIPSEEPWKPQIDFIGVNYYRSVYVYYQPGLPLVVNFLGGSFDGDLHGNIEKPNLLNDFGWEIYPEGLYRILFKTWELYQLPIYITENGITEHKDRNRAPYITSHLEQISRARKEGVDVKGYIHWSLLDNWELQAAYSSDAKFGLFTVDRMGNRDSNNTFPRHITEGALALQYIIADAKLKNAVDKFGRISPKGDMVEPQKITAGAVWEGTVLNDNSRFILYMNCLEDGRLIGMIFYHDLHEWVRIESENIFWDGENLIFSHNSNTSAGSRKYTVQVSNGTMVNCFINGAGQWEAKKVELYGLWNITPGKPAPFDKLYFSKMEGEYAGWSGKVYAKSSSSWEAIDNIKGDGKELEFKYQLKNFTCRIDSGDKDKMTINSGSRGRWEAKNARDNLFKNNINSLKLRVARSYQ